MNKKHVIIACAACALLLGGALAESAETPAPVESAAVEPAVKGSQTISWPQEYLISYEYQLADGRVGQIAQGRDAQGNIYFQSDGVETLFAADGFHYLAYRTNAAGELEQQPDMYSETYVQEQISTLVDYASKASQWYLDEAVYTGDGEVAGRPCALYSYERDFLNYTLTCTMAVDNATGLCLEWRTQSSVSGHDVSDGEGDFICTAFETENVVLPLPVPE